METTTCMEASAGATPVLATPGCDYATRAGVVPLSDEDLEARLCVLAGSLAVAEAEFLHLLVDLDDRGLWGNLGMRSAAHWLSWRLGMGLTAAREKVRVAHALRQLPGIAAAFGSALLTYCKVRALVRVATPATEAELLELALGATGRAVGADRAGLAPGAVGGELRDRDGHPVAATP